MTEAAALGADTDAVGFTDRTARGDCVLFMHPDDPPASSPPWIDAVNALATLQHAVAKVCVVDEPFRQLTRLVAQNDKITMYLY